MRATEFDRHRSRKYSPGDFPGGPPDADHSPDVLMSTSDFGKADDLGCPVVVLFLERGNGTPRFAHSAVTAYAIVVGSERDHRKRAGLLV